MGFISLRRLTLLCLTALALRGFAPSGESDLPSGRVETAKPAVEETATSPRGSTYSPAKAVPVSAELSLGLNRPERKLTEAEVYDLFSRTSRSSQPTSRKQKPEPRAGATVESAPTVQPDPVLQTPPEPPVVTAAVAPPAVAPVAPPPPPVVVAAPLPPAPPPAPIAPVLPFKYIGRIMEAGHSVFFLTKDDKLYTVKVGDEIEGMYYVDGEIGGQLRLIYKPLSIAQTLAVGASS